jgi:hypothetical protein
MAKTAQPRVAVLLGDAQKKEVEVLMAAIEPSTVAV